MSVNIGGQGIVCMAEQLLDGFGIRSSQVQQGGKGVSRGVGGRLRKIVPQGEP